MILVTGGAGFIGSNIVAELNARGTPVAVCDYLGVDDKWRNLAGAELCDFVSPDELDGWLTRMAKPLRAIVHMGAITATDASDGDLLARVNFGLSWHLWRWCTQHGKQFVYASSAATYGNGDAGYDDDWSPQALARLRPLNLYGWSKHVFDRRIVRAVSNGESTPVQWVGLKFFNVYGPNEHHKQGMRSVIAQKYPAAARGEAITLFKSYDNRYADGAQQRDFVYVGDCVDLVLWILDHPHVNGIFNVGSGEARSFSDLAAALFAALDQSPRIRYIDMPEEMRGRYQYFTQARLQRLRTAGYTRPFTRLEDGVKHYVTQYLSHTDSQRRTQ